MEELSMVRNKIETITKSGRIQVKYTDEHTAQEYILQQQEQCSLLIQNFELLLANKERIYEEPEWFFCKIPSKVGASYCGGKDIALGALFKLYDNNLFIIKCPDCSNTLYLITAGSGLSLNVCVGYCINEKMVKRTSIKGFNSSILKPCFKMINCYSNQDVRIPATNPKFTWSGLVGEYQPERVIKSAIKGIELIELIKILKGNM